MITIQKYLFLFLFFLLTNFSYGQEDIKNNKFVLGGTMYYNTNTEIIPVSYNQGFQILYIDLESKLTSIGGLPYFGIQVSERWLLGLELGYEQQKINEGTIELIAGTIGTNQRNLMNKAYSVALFTRFIVNPKHQLKFVLQPYVGYQLSNRQRLIGSQFPNEGVVIQDTEFSYTQLGIGNGLIYEVNPRWNIIATSNFLSFEVGNARVKGSGVSNKVTDFTANLSLASVRLGFEVKF